jgi:DNA-directed RNA polymerase specialized sigma24 family protein
VVDEQVERYTLTNIPPPDPDEEQEADALLKANHAADDPEYPAYSEEYLSKDREQRRGTLRLIDDAEEYFAEPKPVTNLVDVNWPEIRRGAIRVGVSERQMLFIEWRRMGFTIREIANETDWSRQTVCDDLGRAADRIQDTPEFALYQVLAEVFSLPVETVRFMCKHVNN